MPKLEQAKPSSAQRIANRLGNRPTGRPTDASVVTNPTRCVTNTYVGGFQAVKGDQPKKGENDYD
jgi:hypothetical protein